MASLIFNGVLKRYPGLKVVVAHGGGYLPFHPSRLDHAWEVRPECRVHIDEPPSSYLKQIYVDTVVYTPESVAQLVGMMGADHVLLGTDYPFDMGEEDPVGLVERTPGLSDEEREMIWGGNAARLLGLGLTLRCRTAIKQTSGAHSRCQLDPGIPPGRAAPRGQDEPGGIDTGPGEEPRNRGV